MVNKIDHLGTHPLLRLGCVRLHSCCYYRVISKMFYEYDQNRTRFGIVLFVQLAPAQKHTRMYQHFTMPDRLFSCKETRQYIRLIQCEKRQQARQS